jgi:hypothetical protein
MSQTLDVAAEFEAIVGHLGADELAHLAGVLHARAADRRRQLTIEEAWSAYDAAPLTPAWELSIVPEVGRVRIATRILVGDRRMHPEQVADAMTVVAERVCVHPAVAVEVVAAGIVDGMETREGDRP